LFLRTDHGHDQAGGTATLSFGRAIVPPVQLTSLEKLGARLASTDWAPDLGARIGSPRRSPASSGKKRARNRSRRSPGAQIPAAAWPPTISSRR
jgi:hypothetical protein